MPNANWKAVRISVILSLVFFAGIFVPSLLGMDGFNGGFALSVFSGFFMMIGIISAAVYASLARQQDKLFAGQDLLARWTYTQDEWKQYFADESAQDRKMKTWMFYLVVFWALVCGIGFMIYDTDNGIYVLYMMLGLIVLIGFVAWLSIRLTKHKLEKHGGEAWISTTGAFIAGQMHSWDLTGNSLSQVTYLDDEKQPQIEIEYFGGNTSYSVRIPVPTGKADEARMIAQKLAQTIKH